MRAVLDINLLLSALIRPDAPPDLIYRAWEEGRFVLVTSEWQLDELRRASRYPRLQKYVKPHEADAMVGGLRLHALVVRELAEVEVAPDPDDDPLIATALSGGAGYLVTGDRGLLGLERVDETRIIDARTFLESEVSGSSGEKPTGTMNPCYTKGQVDEPHDHGGRADVEEGQDTGA